MKAVFLLLAIISFPEDTLKKSDFQGNKGGSGSYWTVYFDSDTLDIKLARFIGGAQYSLDICFYEIFRDTVAKAIINAKERGVKVRVITDYDYYFRPYMDSMRNHGIPVIHEQVGSNTDHIMHNKFIVRDYRDADTTNDCLWTGSYNASEYTRLNAENAILLVSHSVATPYFYEFNQMWGDTADIPDTLNARTGSRKIDAYPQHLFVVNDDSIWVYFSPQNRPIQYLISFVNSSQDSIGYLIYSYTRDDLASAMISTFQRGVFVGGVHDASDVGSPYSVFQTLVSNGLPVFRDNLPPNYGILHHKFMVIDRTVVITGSMNWSNNGNQVNDENTLIIRNREIAEIYWQEFRRRYGEAMSVSDSFKTPSSIQFLSGESVTFPFIGYKVFDGVGRLVADAESSNTWAGKDSEGKYCPAGIYFVLPTHSRGLIKVIKIRAD